MEDYKQLHANVVEQLGDAMIENSHLREQIELLKDGVPIINSLEEMKTTLHIVLMLCVEPIERAYIVNWVMERVERHIEKRKEKKP